MRGGSPSGTLWSNVTIDAAKDMLGFALTNLGNVEIRGNNLRTTDLSLREYDAVSLTIRDLADTAYRDLLLRILTFSTLGGVGATPSLSPENTDARPLLLQARDSGVGLVEVARLMGAADPYFQATLPMRLNPAGAPGVILEGHFWYDAGSNRLMYRDDAATRTVLDDSIGARITTGNYTGDDSVNRAIAHGLGVVPKVVFIASGVWTYRIQQLLAYIYWDDRSTPTLGQQAVTAPSATNFYVGNAADYLQSANLNTQVCQWVAIG